MLNNITGILSTMFSMSIPLILAALGLSLIHIYVMFYHGRVIRKAGLLRFKITADGCLRISPGAKQTD